MTAVGLDREDAYHPANELALKMLCAGIANAVGSMVTNPADLTKVRQQLYIKQAQERLSPSFPATLARMVREEGILSIYKGLTASMAREMSYSSIRMGMYDLFKTSITTANPRIDPHSMTVKLLAGMGSGCLGAAVANPADLVKVRLQAAGNTMTLTQHVLDIYRQQGIAGYWRGVVPTVFRAGILTSSQLGSYDGTKQFFKREMPKQFPEGFRTHLICSGIAGFVCSVASAPVDTIKVRMMNDSKRQYKNAIHATALLLRYEGPFALYKGFFGCWIRLWPQTVISLITMEKLRKIVGLNPI